MTPAASRPRGFTLLEIMIAVAISSIIGVVIFGAFQRAYAIKDSIEAADERYSTARVALSRMAREISLSFISEHYDHKRFRERPTIFKSDHSGDRDALLFTSFAHERLFRDAKESDQALLEYKMDSDPDRPGEYALWRREKVHFDEDMERGGQKALLAEGVTSLNFWFWDWKKNEWTTDWNTASTERIPQLPVRVRIRIGLRMPDGKEKKFETQTKIAMIRPLDF